MLSGTISECLAQSKLCPNTSKLWDQQTQSCETCQQLGYPNGWIANQNKGVCEPNVNGGGSTPPSEPPPICTCASWGPTCTNSQGTVVDPPAGFCLPSSVPIGISCTCSNGSPNCVDSNHNSVPTPSSFNPNQCTIVTTSCSSGINCQGSSFCNQNPTDPDCVDYCTAHPTDSDCKATCADHPELSYCSGGGDEYCLENPADPDCSGYCAYYPDDPVCSGDITGGGGGSGGGGNANNCIQDPDYCRDESVIED